MPVILLKYINRATDLFYYRCIRNLTPYAAETENIRNPIRSRTVQKGQEKLSFGNGS